MDPSAQHALPEARRLALEAALGRPDQLNDPDSTLNLNCEVLREARKAALKGVQDFLGVKYRGRTATREQRQAEAQTLLARPQYPRFISLQVAYLQRETVP